jgi:hypothetical protein
MYIIVCDWVLNLINHGATRSVFGHFRYGKGVIGKKTLFQAAQTVTNAGCVRCLGSMIPLITLRTFLN